MQTTFGLLDMENVPADALPNPVCSSVRIKVFLGPHQTKIPVTLARGLQTFGPHVEYIQMQGIGHNALDFHITYYLGRLTVEHPTARFVIVSKDAGFDPLISHLQSRKIHCERVPNMAALVPVLERDGKPGMDRAAIVIADLTKRQGARPRTLKTLSSTVQSLFRKQLPEGELSKLLAELNERGVFKVSNGRLTYGLPKEPPAGL